VKALLLCLLLLAGCSSNTAWKINAGTPNPGAQASVHVHTGSDFAALFGLGLLAAGVYGAERTGFFWGDTRSVPELHPNRKVSEQDCTKPLDYSLGNIRCK
jgi:hypothetical protein